LSDNRVHAILEDHLGGLWIGTGADGLNRLDRDTGKFTQMAHDVNDPASLSDNRVTCIFEDSLRTLWVGTMGGLNQLDRESIRFRRHLWDPLNPESLIGNNVKRRVDSLISPRRTAFR
jgi:ligand-binding sensor domain-containing protein